MRNSATIAIKSKTTSATAVSTTAVSAVDITPQPNAIGG